ncbi:hypothetical protein IW261DRAFT_1564696 [Armillaria novae-zelandiae]|uniref:Uncharacterized protein n=1 Tax=Armillaria novae-zelandiae TaxID=153914 RepID=A0AA39TC49_9AGAR|nr:hypothetical protein IW261DRAFT_1564696 [Armillaria novae-zelandiae]
METCSDGDVNISCTRHEGIMPGRKLYPTPYFTAVLVLVFLPAQGTVFKDDDRTGSKRETEKTFYNTQGDFV